MNVTVVIPTYNEADNLPRLVEALFALPAEDLSILVVDDQSPDGTGAVAERLAAGSAGRLAVLHRQGERGFGKSYLEGFRAALAGGAQAVVQMDADLSHPPGLLPELLAALKDCDIAVGSRYIPGGGVDQAWPGWRKGLSHFGNFYARSLLGLTVQDVTGGFRAWRASVLAELPLERVRSNGYAFQVEMIYLASRLGYTCREIPFYFPDRQFGQSKMSFRVQREAALRVWQMRWEYRDLPGFKKSQ